MRFVAGLAIQASGSLVVVNILELLMFSCPGVGICHTRIGSGLMMANLYFVTSKYQRLPSIFQVKSSASILLLLGLLKPSSSGTISGPNSGHFDKIITIIRLRHKHLACFLV